MKVVWIWICRLRGKVKPQIDFLKCFKSITLFPDSVGISFPYNIGSLIQYGGNEVFTTYRRIVLQMQWSNFKNNVAKRKIAHDEHIPPSPTIKLLIKQLLKMVYYIISNSCAYDFVVCGKWLSMTCYCCFLMECYFFHENADRLD